MEDVERLLKNTVAELNKLLNAKNVLGDPIERDGATVVPIVSYGFGFGAGSGSGGEGAKAKSGGATGGGGGIKPMGAIIIDKDGARVEAVKGTVSSLVDVIGNTATKVLKRTSKTDEEDDSAEA